MFEHYDDILDATYEIVLMFCAPVFVDFSLISVVCRPMQRQPSSFCSSRILVSKT